MAAHVDLGAIGGNQSFGSTTDEHSRDCAADGVLPAQFLNRLASLRLLEYGDDLAVRKPRFLHLVELPRSEKILLLGAPICRGDYPSPGVGEFKPSAGFTCLGNRARSLFALASELCQWPNQRLQPTRIPPLRGSMRSAEAER